MNVDLCGLGLPGLGGLLGLTLSLALGLLGLALGLLLCSGLLWRIPDSLERFSNIVLDSWSSLGSDLRLGLQQSRHAALLLAHEWHGLEFLLPICCDSDGVLLGLFAADGVPLSICMVDCLLDLFWILRIPDIVEVGTITLATLWEF